MSYKYTTLLTSQISWEVLGKGGGLDDMGVWRVGFPETALHGPSICSLATFPTLDVVSSNAYPTPSVALLLLLFVCCYP